MKNNTYQSDGKEAFHILICLIQIWDKADGLMMPPTNRTLEIAEVESVEISDTYEKLINTAKVRFPRGTVIRVTSENEEELKKNAELVTATLDERGVLVNTHTTKAKVASVNDFSVGKRIRIYLGYTTNPKIAALPKFNGTKATIFTDKDLRKQYIDELTNSPYYMGPMFDGFITRCSIDTPIELECEDLASVLKQKNAPNIPQQRNLTVNDLLAPDGKWKMLEGTGLELHPSTKKCNIDIGPILLNNDLTVADVLNTWTKNMLFSYVWVDYPKYGEDREPKPYVLVGRSYFTNNSKDSLIKQREEQGFVNKYEIDFNYNVAENGLTLMDSNKDYLCIQGQCMEKNGKTYHMTIRKNPEWKEGDPEGSQWQILNEIKLTPKMQRMGATIMSKSGTNKVDLSRYNIVPYMSRKIGISHDELLQELIEYYEGYHTNGIDGTLTLFGDLMLRSGTKVHLSDPYFPAKNGTYFINEVTTKFGTRGFRQTIKLPYCITRDDEKDK